MPDLAGAPDTTALISLVANVHAGLVVLDRTQRIRLCNPAAGALFDVAPAAVIDQPLARVLRLVGVRLIDREATAKQWQAALQSAGRRPRVDVTVQRTDGVRELEASLFPVDAPRGGVGVLVRDVTEERAVARERSNFFSILSHEIRQPLTGVVGYAELLAVGNLPPAQARISVDLIQHEAQRLASLIDEVLDLQRLETGRVAYHKRPVKVQSVVARVVGLYSVQSDRHRVVVQVPASLPPVHADPDKLQQVLSNLVSNAIKYSPNGGQISIEAGEENRFVRIAVRDQGLGIPPEALPRLFRPFVRVETEDRQGIPGTGLGLAAARRIVEDHGGRIEAHSTPGAGSTFSFTIPVAA